MHFGSKFVWVDAPPRTLFLLMRAPYMAALMPECIVAGKAEAPEAPEEQILEEWEFIAVSPPPIIRAWSRMVRGAILTISNLKRCWGHLGHYLKEVKRRGITSGLPQGHYLGN